nr:MAG TPA: hypothetical protein [Bacteriophage sp.]
MPKRTEGCRNTVSKTVLRKVKLSGVEFIFFWLVKSRKSKHLIPVKRKKPEETIIFQSFLLVLEKEVFVNIN